MTRGSLLVPVVSCVALFAACNSITGVDDLASSGAGNSGAGEPLPPPLLAAQGVTISEVAIYQGVKRSLMGGTPPISGVTVPIVAGRPALLRVFVKTDAGYDKSPVTAHLYLGSDEPIEVVGVVGDGNDAQLESTVNFEIPGEKMTVGQTFRVDLQQPVEHTPGTNTAAVYPAMGMEPLDVKSDGMQLKIVIVPVQYGADGSDRLPDLSQKQIDGYRDSFFGTYPAANVEVTVRAQPFAWNQKISPNGNGWDSVLDAVSNLRQKDKVASDVYYFGAFNPNPTFDQFCSQGCVAGLGSLGSPQDTYSRAAVGIGYSGDLAWTTAIHETGHNHGRNHAPCGGADGVDPKFPYDDGGIGVWGYDLVSKKLVSPMVGTDLMGYCEPYWISDYNYKALFDRMKLVNKASLVIPEELKNRTWERARLDGAGNLTWLDPVTMERPPMGASSLTVTRLRSGGAEPVEGQFFPYDHLAGGVLLWPQADVPSVGIELRSPELTSQDKPRTYRRRAAP